MQSFEVEPRFFTLEETARYLNVSRPQVYSLVRSGELPAIKLGGRGVWRVDRRQLESYIERLLKETHEWAKAHPLSQERETSAGDNSSDKRYGADNQNELLRDDDDGRGGPQYSNDLNSLTRMALGSGSPPPLTSPPGLTGRAEPGDPND